MNEEIESSRGSGVMKAEASDTDVGNQKEEQTSSTTDTECTTNSSKNTKSDVIIPTKPEPQTPEHDGPTADISSHQFLKWFELAPQFLKIIFAQPYIRT